MISKFDLAAVLVFTEKLMSGYQPDSTVVSYATPRRTRRHRWAYVVSGLAAAGLLVGPFVRLSGQRLVGFHYGVFLNNAATICPHRVTAQSGTVVHLADGRAFDLDADAEQLKAGLATAENMVFVDVEHRVLYGRSRVAHCGFSRPVRSQWITIPLFRQELNSHSRHIIAGLDKPKRVAAVR